MPDLSTNALMLLSAATFSPIEDFSLSAIIAPNKTTGPIVAAKELATPVAAVVHHSCYWSS